MSIKAHKILVIGDVMIDRYIVGKYHRNSPEADCAVLNYERTEDRLGGAANVALNLAKLNQHVSLISVTGEDEGHTIIKKLCSDNHIEFEHVSDPTRPTTIKKRFVDNDFRQFLRVDIESKEYVHKHIAIEILGLLKDKIKAGLDLIIIQDYNKGLLSEQIINSIQKLCRVHQIKLSVDPKHKYFSLLSNCDIFKPNIKELEFHYNQKIDLDSNSIYEAVTQLNIGNAKMIFVTLAEHGIYYQSDTERGIINGVQITDADVSGAGDTVIAVLSFLLLREKSIKQMATIANKCGAFVCKLQGVNSINISDFQEITHKDNSDK
jgi:rfaE bifunctional protein kinase chain/domain